MYGVSYGARRYFSGAGCPVTLALIAANGISFFVGAIATASNPFRWLIFLGSSWPDNFWTILTWPLVGGGHPFFLLLVCAWAFWVCGSLERSWGTRTFTGFFAAMSALMALSVWIGGRLLGVPVGLAGLHFAVAAPTIAWCVINRRETINLWGILPLPAPLLALLTILLVWYEIGPPFLGLFGLTSCLVAYLYASYGRYAYRGYAPVDNKIIRLFPRRKRTPPRPRELEEGRGFFLTRWLRARQEQRRLEKLWGSSDLDPPPDKP